MFDFIAQVLALFYELPGVGGNYGVAIILLTIAVMIVLMPLTLRATRSTIKMQQVQPEMKRLQKEYKDDREAMNRELMALYSEHGINPIGGCVPMLAQLPVFLVLFNVLRGLTRRSSETAFFEVANQVRVRTGLDMLDPDTFNPQYVSRDSALYEDLHRDTEMAFGPFDLAARAIDVIQDNILRGIPYVLLIGFVVFSSYFQQRQVSARRTPGAEDSPMMAQQQMLLKFLPLLSGVWSFLFPAGLVVYWATSNLFRIGQQAYITRQIYGKEGASEKLAEAKELAKLEDAKKPEKKSDAKSDAKSDNNKSDKNTASDSDDSSQSNGAKSNGAKSNGSKSNGASSDDGSKSKAERRAEEWEAMRAERAARKAAKKGSSSSSSSSATPSSRITPKGTAPSKSNKKRKK